MSVATPTPAAERGGAAPRAVVGRYQPPHGLLDEMYSAPGELRPHWTSFVRSIDALGADELLRRWQIAQRVIHENGVTYNLHADPQGLARPWDLDPLPLLLSSSEWAQISLALIQRARLLNLILADIYGPQELLAQGMLPPELVFAQPGFLRACHGLRVPDDCWLNFYAGHLARNADGNWCVLADRTQAPSGAGYAVENRIVISQMLPALFHESQVQRLAAFFITLRETLRGLARRNRDNPRIVLLSPGARSPTYFEDAYLSRYLGYTLVTGGDLAVRDHRVFLKTLGGLLPVDVIFRRVWDVDCDPLELRGDSLTGVPGLTQAARLGNVAIANALGSGLLEGPALMAFLPELCQHVLGEPLKMPSAPTWWCGRPQDHQYVISHLDELVIKRAFPPTLTSSIKMAPKPIFGDQLSSKEKGELLAAIAARPRDFVAQQRIARSSAPVWNGGELTPRHVALRTFVVANEGSYSVMPGGLTRMSPSKAALADSVGCGEGSKDIWVLSDGPVSQVSLLHPAGQPIALRRSGNELPSRVADNLFWLGRHVERAEGTVRLLRSLVLRLTGESKPENIPELGALLQVLADQGQIVARDIDQRAGVPEREIFAFLFDPNRPRSLRANLTAIINVASVVRDRISIDAWRILNRVDQDFAPLSLPQGAVQLSDVLAMLNQAIINLAAFSGLGMESMTRTQAWRFLDMGRRLERALFMSGLVQSALVPGMFNKSSVLETLLEIADSAMTYRSRYLTTLQAAPVIDLLLLDESNPRSVAFQLVALSDHVENLPRERSNPQRTPEQRVMMTALSTVRLAEIDALSELDEGDRRTRLDRLLDRLAKHLRNLSDSIAHTYLIHAGPARQLAEIARD